MGKIKSEHMIEKSLTAGSGAGIIIVRKGAAIARDEIL